MSFRVSAACCSLLVGLLLSAGRAFAAEPSFAEIVAPILKKHCVECHSGKEPKGELRLDGPAPALASEATQEEWLQLVKRVTTNEMPPKEKPRLNEQEKKTLADWVQARVSAEVAKKRTGQGR